MNKFRCFYITGDNLGIICDDIQLRLFDSVLASSFTLLNDGFTFASFDISTYDLSFRFEEDGFYFFELVRRPNECIS